MTGSNRKTFNSVKRGGGAASVVGGISNSNNQTANHHIESNVIASGVGVIGDMKKSLIGSVGASATHNKLTKANNK